jgi:signal transduction histidine kinase
MASSISYKNRNIIIIFSIIAIAAILFGIAFHQYYASVSNEILELAAQDIKSNLEIQTRDISQILEARVDSISNNLQLLSNAISMENKLGAEGNALLDAAEASNNLTDFYIWLDSRGRMERISNMNQSIDNKGTNFSDTDYFSIPRQSHRPHYSSIIDSNDKIPRLYISYPIIANSINNDSNNSTSTDPSSSTPSPQDSMQSNQEFKGVVAAAIRFDTIGELLQKIVPSKYNLSVGFIDREGIILYSRNKSFIGKNVFEQDLQSTVPYHLRESFNRFVSQSLITNDMPNIQDLTDEGNTTSFGYQPISFGDYRIGTLYIMAPHNLAENVENLTNQQKTLGIAIYTVIGSIAMGIAYVFLIWNKKLHTQVEKRTIELHTSNKRLHVVNEELKKNDAIQTQFINTAAHELRTPIQSIVGYMELLQTSSDWDKLKNSFSNDSKESLESISRNAIRLQNLTNDILDATRIESSTLKLNKEKIFINEKLMDIIKDVINCNIQIKQKEIQILLDESNFTKLDPHYSSFIEVDRSRLQQVLTNLINNSANFSDKKGTVTIYFDPCYSDSNDSKTSNNRDNNNPAKSRGLNELIVKVKDRGKGIDPDIQSRLFTKFASIPPGGTGLGLYISKNIIMALDGKIWAENNSDGKGATFSFSLPLNIEDNWSNR